MIAFARVAIAFSLHISWTIEELWANFPIRLLRKPDNVQMAAFERPHTRLLTLVEIWLLFLLCQYAFLAIDIHLRGWMERALEAFWAVVLPAHSLVCVCQFRAPDFLMVVLRRSTLAKHTFPFDFLVHSGVCKLVFGSPSRHKP